MSGELTFATVPETDRWAQHLGIVIVEITPERVHMRLETSEKHHQPMGILHGGVWASIVETIEYSSETPMGEVTVPNTENVSMQTLMKALILVPQSAVALTVSTQVSKYYSRDHANFDCSRFSCSRCRPHSL